MFEQYKVRKIQNKDVLELLGYMIICNQHIHTLQLAYIEKCLKENADIKKHIYSILMDQQQHTLSELKELMDQEDHKTRDVIFHLLLNLACMDGTFDETERDHLLDIFPQNQIKERWVRRRLRTFKKKTQGIVVVNFMKIVLTFCGNQLRRLMKKDACASLETCALLLGRDAKKQYKQYKKKGEQLENILNQFESADVFQNKKMLCRP